jgi:hypothetical protein
MHFAYDLSECFFFAQVGRAKISKKRIPHKQVLKQSLYDYRRKKHLRKLTQKKLSNPKQQLPRIAKHSKEL